MVDALIDDIWTPGDRPPYSLSSSPTDEKEEMVITNVRATDIALGLRRVPVGFYAVVHRSGLEWRTENKRSSVNDDVVGWSGQIASQSDLSTIVLLEIRASQPMLGTGERLRQLTITVEQLLDCSTVDVPFTFFTDDGDVVSPCSSIFVTQTTQVRGKSISAQTWSSLFNHRTLGRARRCNKPALSCSRYRKYDGKRDLERSITVFDREFSLCPLSHPCRVAVQSNLAMAKFILYQVEGRDDTFEDSLELYRNAFVVRPVGHADRPSTLLWRTSRDSRSG